LGASLKKLTHQTYIDLSYLVFTLNELKWLFQSRVTESLADTKECVACFPGNLMDLHHKNELEQVFDAVPAENSHQIRVQPGNR
jgi:hypothetical protein